MNKKKIAILSDLCEQYVLSTFNITTPFQLKLHFVTSAAIRKLNAKYRFKNKVTDVLSFPLFDFRYQKMDRQIAKNQELFELGDIFICKEVAKKQAKEFNISYEEEVLHLFVHGFLHLLGYDHEKSKSATLEMEREEAILIKQIYKEWK